MILSKIFNGSKKFGGKTAIRARQYFKKPKKPKKAIIASLAVVFCLSCFLVIRAMSAGAEPADAVSVGTAARANLAETVSVAGFIEGAESADVVSQIDSEIVSILVSAGDKVKKDQVLAVLDGADLSRDAVLAQTSYEKAKCDLQAELERAQRDYDDAQRAFSEARRIYEANQMLYAEGAISREEFIRSENSFHSAKACLSAYSAINGTVQATPSQLKSLEMEKESLDRKKAELENIYIKSPIDGTVTRVNARLGRYASDTENDRAMFIIEDLANMQMEVKISEYDIGRLAIGQKARISSDVLGRETVPGTVSAISPTGEQKSATQSEMVVPVRIDITGAGPGLIAGVSAKARIEIAKASNVLAVPLEAILEHPENGTLMVYTISRDGVLKAVPVETGIEGDFLIEIVGGDLKEGDRVVLNPSLTYEDGMQVPVKED